MAPVQDEKGLIVQAARAFKATYGHTAFTRRELARLAGVEPLSLSKAFPSRASLLAAIGARLRETYAGHQGLELAGSAPVHQA